MPFSKYKGEVGRIISDLEGVQKKMKQELLTTLKDDDLDLSARIDENISCLKLSHAYFKDHALEDTKTPSEDPRYEVWASTLNTKSRCRVRTGSVKIARAVFDKCCASLPKLKGEVGVYGPSHEGEALIVGIWYSGSYEHPIRGRHRATHPKYSEFFNDNKEKRGLEHGRII